MKKNKKVKILWEDARIFSPERKNVKLSLMETTGFLLETESDSYYLIRNPVTINFETKIKHPNKNPFFYLIPNGGRPFVKILVLKFKNFTDCDYNFSILNFYEKRQNWFARLQRQSRRAIIKNPKLFPTDQPAFREHYDGFPFPQKPRRNYHGGSQTLPAL